MGNCFILPVDSDSDSVVTDADCGAIRLSDPDQDS